MMIVVAHWIWVGGPNNNRSIKAVFWWILLKSDVLFLSLHISNSFGAKSALSSPDVQAKRREWGNGGNGMIVKLRIMTIIDN